MASHATWRRKVKLSDGRSTTDVVVEVSSPMPRASRWYCIVHFPKMMGDPIKVAGEDEMQALTRAFGLLADLVDKHRQIGWTVTWMTDGDGGRFSIDSSTS